MLYTLHYSHSLPNSVISDSLEIAVKREKSSNICLLNSYGLTAGYFLSFVLGCGGGGFSLFWLRGMWDLTSLTRDQTHTPCMGSKES